MAADEVEDLTKVGAPGAEDESAVTAPVEAAFNPDPERERVRGRIALILVWATVAVVGAAMLISVVTMGLCWTDVAQCSDDTINLRTVSIVLGLVLTPLVGLVGAVTGFYYGEKAGRANANGEDI